MSGLMMQMRGVLLPLMQHISSFLCNGTLSIPAHMVQIAVICFAVFELAPRVILKKRIIVLDALTVPTGALCGWGCRHAGQIHHTLINMHTNANYMIRMTSAYSEAFESVSGASGTYDPVNIMYHLPKSDWAKYLELEPKTLYEHVFKVLNKVLWAGPFGKVSGSLTSGGMLLFIAGCLIAILGCLTARRRKTPLLMTIIYAAFGLVITAWNIGAGLFFLSFYGFTILLTGIETQEN